MTVDTSAHPGTEVTYARPPGTAALAGVTTGILTAATVSAILVVAAMTSAHGVDVWSGVVGAGLAVLVVVAWVHQLRAWWERGRSRRAWATAARVEARERAAASRTQSWSALGLVAFVVLVFVVTIIKMGANVIAAHPA